LVSKQLNSISFFDPVQDLIPLVEERMRQATCDHNPELGLAIDHLLSSGGKRVRPAVALLTGRMLEGDEYHLVTLAAAIEMLHTATLVHDDLIDGALLRRGISTLNARWSPAATVLTGDFMFARAAKLAAEAESVDVMQLFAETLSSIVNGEIAQMFPDDGKTSRENYDQRIFAKTASMFELATGAAAMLSPVNEIAIERIRRYGHAIGMAFQIVDDVLDFTGEQATVGKPVASDLRQGLVTLPALYYLEAYPNDPDMAHIRSGTHYEETIMDRLVTSIRESGAIQKAMDDSQRYIDQSLEILDEMPDNLERHALEDLANYITGRRL
jgi:geranylgeranyl pyrophosphate synthase